jgi:hypothetical protein
MRECAPVVLQIKRGRFTTIEIEYDNLPRERRITLREAVLVWEDGAQNETKLIAADLCTLRSNGNIEEEEV